MCAGTGPPESDAALLTGSGGRRLSLRRQPPAWLVSLGGSNTYWALAACAAKLAGSTAVFVAEYLVKALGGPRQQGRG